MDQPNPELIGFQPNPNNDFGKCSNCGKLLQSKQEEKMQLCAECQKRHKDKEVIGED
ncbi:hypothetical protein [Radiobacillus sp. PE A8.2]|uniref:hypothetical protein n=1 Tax=Radiobacillus sp. PE A8.2 TaxID=3380349 RepID=UPI003890E7AB